MRSMSWSWCCFACCCVLILLAACDRATDAAIPRIVDPVVEPFPISGSTRSVEFRSVVPEIETGQIIGALRWDIGCMASNHLRWNESFSEGLDPEFEDIFYREMERANVTLAVRREDLFDQGGEDRAENLRIAGRVIEIRLNGCLHYDREFLDAETYSRVKWQVYDAKLRRVVYEVVTEGRDAGDRVISEDLPDVIAGAYGMSVRNLISDQGFRQLLAGGV